MAAARKKSEIGNSVGAPARTPEQLENQLISMAFDRAHQQLQDGTISSQALTYLLKLGSEKEQLERRNLEMDLALKEARKEQMGSVEKQNELYEKALRAFSRYQGEDVEDLD